MPREFHIELNRAKTIISMAENTSEDEQDVSIDETYLTL